MAKYDDPTTIFFDSNRAYDQRYSAARAEEAAYFINDLEQWGEPNKRETSLDEQPPWLCLGMPMVARIDPGFDVNPGDREWIFFDVLVAHTDPLEHPAIQRDWLGLLPGRILRYSVDGRVPAKIKTWEQGGWYRNKSIYDYAYLLNDCFGTGAMYIAMVEDDTLAVADWITRLRNALDLVEAQMDDRHPGQHWIYLRLFFTDHLMGWNRESWPTYLFWSLATWTALTMILLVIKKQLPRRLGTVTPEVLVTISLVCIPVSITLLFLAGKQTLLPLTPGVHEMNRYGCCSQGLVYPRAIVPYVIEQLRVEEDALVDMQVERMANEANLTRWATVPPLLQHIGSVSSKGYGFDDNARAIWSFQYEKQHVEYPEEG